MTADPHPAWRPLATVPLSALPTAGGALVAVGLLVDVSPLRRVDDPLASYALAAVVVLLSAGVPAMLLAGAIELAAAKGPARWWPRLAWLAAVLCVLCGLGLVVLAGVSMAEGPAAGLVFGCASAAIGSVLAALPVARVRRRRRGPA